MQCANAQTWLQSRRDIALAAAQQRELDQHLVHCDACAAFERDLRLVDRWLLQAPVEEPAANFEWRLKLRLAQIDRDARVPALPVRTAVWRPWAQFGGAMAAAALVVVAVGSQLISPRPAPLRSHGPSLVPAPQGGVVQPVRDDGPGSPTFVGPPVPQPYSYFVAPEGSAVSELDSSRTPGAPPVH